MWSVMSDDLRVAHLSCAEADEAGDIVGDSARTARIERA